MNKFANQKFLSIGMQWIALCLSLLILGIYLTSFSFSKEVIPSPNFSNQLIKLPLYFEENEGQVDATVKYLTRRNGIAFYFTPQEMIIALKNESHTDNFLSSVLKIQFVGLQNHSHLIGLEKQKYKTNYFIGNDQSQWHTNLSNYAKICYQEIYEGIDALFYGNQEKLEYDFVVNPGANPEDIRLHIEGAEKLSIDPNGNLVITINSQEVQMHKPFIYQMNGENKTPVEGQFVLLAQSDLAFAIGNYDKGKTLIIDPILNYSTFLGSPGNELGNSIAVDSNNNAYVTGVTTSVNFPTTAGAFQTTVTSLNCAFITKLNSTGTALIYSTYLGGGTSSTNIGNGITVDINGNAYVTGVTSASDFPVTAGVVQTTYGGNGDPFITKLNSTGTALIYSTYLGGTNNDGGVGIAIDSQENAYVVGNTTSSNFPVTVGAFQTTNPSPNRTLFIAKLNPTATNLIYSTYLGGSGDDAGRGIVLDSNGNAYVTGFTRSLNFPVTVGAFQTTLNGPQDAFITKLNNVGSNLIYSTYLGGSGEDAGNGIVLDSSNNAYVTGFTSSLNFPVTSGVFQTTLNGPQDAFITKLNAAGNGLIYSTYLGGSDEDAGNGIVIDNIENVYITGSTFSTDFPVTSGAVQTTYGGAGDAFITKLNPFGTEIVYSTYFGGTNEDEGNKIAIDGNADVYITGFTGSLDFPVTSGAYQTNYNGGRNDVFIAKFVIDTPNVTAISPACGPTTGGTIVTITGSNFSNALTVNFGATPASSFTIDNDNQITAVSPAGTGTVDITVTSAGGTSLITVNDQFTYVPAPVITSLNPTQGPAAGGTNVTITGTNFTGTTTVAFGAVSASFTVNSDTEIVATSPAGVPGTVDVTVTTICGGTSALSAADQFTYLAAPIVTSINPSVGCEVGGTTVIITGENFVGVTAVMFGSVNASFIVNSNNQITAISPPSMAGAVNVTVTTLGGTSVESPSNVFTYQQTTTTMLNVTPNPSVFGQPVTLQATITPSSATGTVTFFNGSTPIGTVAVINGSAQLMVFSLDGKNNPLSATYNGDQIHCPSTSSVVVLKVINALPPTHLKGFQRYQTFATQRDIINIITWKAPTHGTSIVAYRIYRDKDLKKLIAIIPNNEKLHFEDHNRKKGKTYTYFIISIDQFGNRSEPAKIIIRGNENDF